MQGKTRSGLGAGAPPAVPGRGRRPEARQRLVRQITACWRTQVVHAAVQLDLPEHLASGPRDAQALAQACACTSDGMHRLLRALCTVAVCRERSDGRFELTRGGAALCRQPADGEPSLRALALWWGGAMWPMWGDLAFSVRTGASARKRQTGLSHYAFMDQQPETAHLFHDAMQAMTALITEDVARHPTWQGARDLVDVGGGSGYLAAAVAAAQVQLRITVLDRADAAAGAQAVFDRRELAGRARFVAGDFFAAVPAGADRYLLKSILHNWDDASCARILERCAQGAAPGARLLLIERVRAHRLKPTHADEALARTDLNMLAGLGGRERSLAEFDALLQPAGFEIVGIAPTCHEFSIIEARRSGLRT